MFFKPTLLLLPFICSALAVSYFRNDEMIGQHDKYNVPAINNIPKPLNIELVGGKNHSLILGRRVYGDRLLYTDVAKLPSKLFRIVETDIKFPNSRTARNDKTINYLSIIDRKANFNGGWPYLTSGGIGAKNVSIHFKSQRSHGLDFLVNIYGY